MLLKLIMRLLLKEECQYDKWYQVIHLKLWRQQKTSKKYYIIIY